MGESENPYKRELDFITHLTSLLRSAFKRDEMYFTHGYADANDAGRVRRADLVFVTRVTGAFVIEVKMWDITQKRTFLESARAQVDQIANSLRTRFQKQEINSVPVFSILALPNVSRAQMADHGTISNELRRALLQEDFADASSFRESLIQFAEGTPVPTRSDFERSRAIIERGNLTLPQASKPEPASVVGRTDVPIALANSPWIFVNYRRSDCPWAAAHISMHLESVAPFRGRIFRDISQIGIGEDWRNTIERALEQIQLMLVLIGPNWLKAKGSDGKRRLDDPDDMLVFEIRTAFERNIDVLPILIDRAAMPRAPFLPESIRKLARIQWLPVTPEDFDLRMVPLEQYIRDLLARRNIH